MTNFRAPPPAVQADDQIVNVFGPLASMHAAFDAIGVGQPCAVAAIFKGVATAEVEHAVLNAAKRFPILRRQILFASGGLPVLSPTSSFAKPRECAGRLLDFCVASGGNVWTQRVRGHNDGVLFEAAFAHAVADGLSMLRLVRAIADELGSPIRAPRLQQDRCASVGGSQFLWTIDFFKEQLRLAMRSKSDASPRPPCTAIWTHLDLEASRRLLALASEYGGVAALLSSASLLTLAALERRTGLQPLEVPIVRSDLRAWKGFGFGVGAILLPTFVSRHNDLKPLAIQIANRLRSAIDSGQDARLERFLGRDFLRHLRLAKHQLRHPGNAPLTVSWKRAQLWEDDGLIGDVGCFASTSNLHISAHGDARGLSISASGRFDYDRIRGLLLGILSRLDVSPTRLIHAFDGDYQNT